MRARTFLFCALLLGTAHAAPPPRLHEPIPADPKEDIEKRVSLIGDLPSALNTRSGPVQAPDPTRPVEATPRSAKADNETFRADRDTRRPDHLPYEDPFIPSTAPFKRTNAYDAVDAKYNLLVSTRELAAMPVGGETKATEDRFFADFTVDLDSGRQVRIPSVAPGQRILRARAGNGAVDVPVTFARDIADNWFVRSTSSGRVRIVMELGAPRAAFGGYGDPGSLALSRQTELPANVRAAADVVARKIGVNRGMRPAENVAKLVAYFRDFVDSDAPLPITNDNIYLDLALSKKGVCRHRAFAFMITALSLGIPTRMVTNEAHAWVEVFDGSLYRRIDLGGAGGMLTDPLSTNVRYSPPKDMFAWPEHANRGEDLARRAAGVSSSPLDRSVGTSRGTASTGSPSSVPFPSSSSSSPSSGTALPAWTESDTAKDPSDRPRTTIALSRADAVAHRRAAVHVEGTVTAADGTSCAHLVVELFLRDVHGKRVRLGATSSDERGLFSTSLVVPQGAPLGDYDIGAFTEGDTHCGRGASK